MKRATNSNTAQEVSRVRSTKPKLFEKNNGPKHKLKAPFGKERIHRKKLNPNYIVGFVDGEGSFSVSIGKHKTLKRKYEVRPEFEIELRADDQEILERVLVTIGCGKIYDLSYDRYGWYPHVKYKITSNKDLVKYLFPFFDKYPLQAKKAKVYVYFKKIVLMMSRKEHLTNKGFEKTVKIREKMRKLGKKAKTYGNR